VTAELPTPAGAAHAAQPAACRPGAPTAGPNGRPRGAIRLAVVYLDGSAAGERALPWALALAGAHGAELLLLHVVAGRAGRATVDAAAAHLWRIRARLEPVARAGGFRLTIAVRRGRPAATVVDTAEFRGADLIVLAVGAGDVRLRTVARRLAVAAPVPVLLVGANAVGGPGRLN
jgi:nucleotide-binding universal stress UspA family protein